MMLQRVKVFNKPKNFVKYICPKCGKLTQGLPGLTIIHEQCKKKFKILKGGE